MFKKLLIAVACAVALSACVTSGKTSKTQVGVHHTSSKYQVQIDLPDWHGGVVKATAKYQAFKLYKGSTEVRFVLIDRRLGLEALEELVIKKRFLSAYADGARYRLLENEHLISHAVGDVVVKTYHMIFDSKQERQVVLFLLSNRKTGKSIWGRIYNKAPRYVNLSSVAEELLRGVRRLPTKVTEAS